MSTAKLWVIDDDASIRWVLERALSGAGHAVQSFANADEALQQLDSTTPDLILCDLRMPGTDGLSFLQTLQSQHATIPVVMMTAHSDLPNTVAAYQNGAFDYVLKPFDLDELTDLVRRALASRQDTSKPSSNNSSANSTIVGAAESMQQVFRAIGRLSRSSASVLINGESGTGKELVAQALHQHSPRAGKAFIALNMAAIPSELLESELFGHEKGAFTGAQQQRRGRFEQAHGGSLFLDEIGDMPASLQTRLLRVLAEGEFYRVGGHQPIRADVRIIAATHQNLEQRVADKLFREDLYHRLNVIRIQVPALRERSDDIPALLAHFLAQAARELGVKAKQASPELVARLQQLPWPGNVRQLENLCQWLTVMVVGQELQASDLPPELRTAQDKPVASNQWEQALAQWAQSQLAAGQQGLLTQSLPTFERILIDAALQHTKGRRQEAASLLGWGRNTLTRKLQDSDR